MSSRIVLARIQIALVVLCSVTYVVSLVYFSAVLPDTIHTQGDSQGKPTFYMGKTLFMAVYTPLLLPAFLVQFHERIRSPRILRRLCGDLNQQASRLGSLRDPLVLRWIALAYYGFVLFVFLMIGVSNYRLAGIGS